MLTKIILRNFKSFKNETVIDFKKTNYTILPQNVADNGVLKGGLFVGGNASGKSTVLDAIRWLPRCLFQEVNIDKELLHCLFTDEQRYEIEYYFQINEQCIQYLIEVDFKKSILVEKLYIDDVLKLERLGSTAKSYIADDTGITYSKEDVSHQALFLRTLYFNTRFASNRTLQIWFEFLYNSIYNVQTEKRMFTAVKENLTLKEYLENYGCEQINAFFNQYQFDQQIEYAQKVAGERYVIVTEDSDTKDIYFCRNTVNAPIPFALESTGNQMLLQLLPMFFYAVSHNCMLIIDEFSSSFHNELEELLVKYFMASSKQSQLFFVSHSTNLLSNSILRPDQEFAVEFHGNEGSCINRFSNEQPRTAQNIEKMYESGVFGGIPSYGEVSYDSTSR